MNIYIINLLKKYINEQCSKQDLEKVFTILQTGRYEIEWKHVIAEHADHVLSSGSQSELSENEVNNIYSGIASRLPSKTKNAFEIWSRIAIAAAIATVIFSASLFYYKIDNNRLQDMRTVYKNDVAPGKTGATLILSNGKKIRLSDAVNGKLAEESGVTIMKSAGEQLVYQIKGNDADSNKFNTLSTAKGETYKVRLPDGSLVFLNAASSLTYATSFNERGKRLVRLRGEGYFEIFKDKKRPFVVQTAKQEVEVLGTHFNVMAYENEALTATTLLEGSVKITSGGRVKILKPNEQAINRQEGMNVIQVNTENIIDWKDGDFYFESVDFRSVMRKISRWYDVEIIYAPSVPKDITSNGVISRNNKLSTVLKLIEKSGRVHFEIEGKKVLVTR